MFGEHHNGGMTEIDSRNVEFLKNEFRSIGEIRKDLVLDELQQDDLLFLYEGENLNTHNVTKGSALPLSGRDDEILVTQENQPRNEVHPHSSIHEFEISPLIQIPTSPRDSGSDSPLVEDSTHPRDRGMNTSVGQTSTGPILMISDHGRIT